MSIRPVLRAVTRPSAESTDLSSSEDQTRRARVSGGHRTVAMSLEWLRFMHGDEFPPNNVLGNPRDERARPLFSGSRYYDAHLKCQGTILHERLPLCDDVMLQCGATFVIYLGHRVRQWRALHVLPEKLLRCRET